MSEISPIEPRPAIPSTVASRMLWLADAYAEGALVLCNSLVEDDYQRQYTSTRVILHLCRHATELFLKGAVFHKTNKPPPNTHRLDKLYAEYRTHYPEEKFDVVLPFPKEILNPKQGLFPEFLDEYIKTHDQRFRYPTDAEGNPFDDKEWFDVAAYQEAIGLFRSNVNHTVARIEFGWKF